MKMDVKLNTAKQLVILSLEPIETRYTCQWFKWLPRYFNFCIQDIEVVQIDGTTDLSPATEGAFLNFIATNHWKSSQATEFFDRVSKGLISDDAVILITDFWNPVVHMIRYTNDLMGKNWKIVGIAHAGMYDPQDCLGRQFKNKVWGTHLETAMFEAYDKVVFATDWHIELFCLGRKDIINHDKILKSGLPFDFLHSSLNYALDKENIILFPHRLAPEKQHDVFLEVSKYFPDYEFVTCQDKNLSKSDYHKLLCKSKVVFSASLQETLGISTCAEALIAGAFPFAPDNLSYEEILPSVCKYPARYAVEKDAQNIAKYLRFVLDNLTSLNRSINSHYILGKYFSAGPLISYIEEQLHNV